MSDKKPSVANAVRAALVGFAVFMTAFILAFIIRHAKNGGFESLAVADWLRFAASAIGFSLIVAGLGFLYHWLQTKKK